MTQIIMIDYGASNIRSAQKAFEHIGAEVKLTNDPEDVRRANKLVLPGVGAFGSGMAGLKRHHLPEAIRESVQRGVPFLGICVGMQLMFSEGHEMGIHEGLNLMAGKVVRFPKKLPLKNQKRVYENARPSGELAASPDPAVRQAELTTLKIPHMGWNQLEPAWDSPLLANVAAGDYTYFVHSYYCDPEDATSVLAWTDYGLPFASVVAKDNVFGLQFHPEKSQSVGLTILQNFVRYIH